MTSDRVGPPPSGRVGAEPGVSGAIGNSGFSSSGAGVGIVDDDASETVFLRADCHRTLRLGITDRPSPQGIERPCFEWPTGPVARVVHLE